MKLIMRFKILVTNTVTQMAAILAMAEFVVTVNKTLSVWCLPACSHLLSCDALSDFDQLWVSFSREEVSPSPKYGILMVAWSVRFTFQWFSWNHLMLVCCWCCRRIEKIEMLDDRDMLTQLCEHYCLCWAHVVREQTSASGGPRIDLGSIALNKIT